MSIGAVIRAPMLRAFPLITELLNISRISDATSETRLSELEEFWDSEMARIGAEGWEKWYASGKPGRHVESNSLNRTSYNWILIVNGHSTKLNEISDVRPSLFEMRYLAARLAFRLARSSFLGLHVPGLTTSITTNAGSNWDDWWLVI